MSEQLETVKEDVTYTFRRLYQVFVDFTYLQSKTIIVYESQSINNSILLSVTSNTLKSTMKQASGEDYAYIKRLMCRNDRRTIKVEFFENAIQKCIKDDGLDIKDFEEDAILIEARRCAKLQFYSLLKLKRRIKSFEKSYECTVKITAKQPSASNHESLMSKSQQGLAAQIRHLSNI